MLSDTTVNILRRQKLKHFTLTFSYFILDCWILASVKIMFLTVAASDSPLFHASATNINNNNLFVQ